MHPSLVISLGGSIVVPDKVDVKFIEHFRDLILGIKKNYNKIFIIVGGGATARVYQNALRELGTEKNSDLDWMGISVSRLNGQLLRTVFSKFAYPELVTDPSKKISFGEKMMIGAGWKPGWSTDYVSVQFAKTYGVREMLNLSNVECVYDKDPKTHPDAKPISSLSWRKMKSLMPSKWTPGMNAPFDPQAVKLASGLGLKVVFLKGTDLGNLEHYLEGKKWKGSVVE
ncbi:MAG: uridylate kinase [Parcubacteria group bacterium Gr01-1014_18]|nr:MAG: uridylate kinase [Parcubacteria group bacterium Greene0416_36]TSC81087.1 MAG: uridylate kinase [Parcubacteria group bacterium Gr01-1014_18]TSC98497.1 MAG: uridylate kinase [Parcubacteria group bacterium Greene1014_20]TSD07338.1 MAG: uridylate kinase [Parcubacteria group bacterium Greene0714_2]